MSAQLKPVPTFARESAADVIDEIKPLLEAHFQEIAHYPDIPLKPDYDFFLKTPSLRVFTVRHQCQLIGYCLFFVAPNPKYMTSLQAHQSILYVSPSHRRGSVGLRFIDWCDTQLRTEGVQVVYHHMKAAHDFGPLLERLGYTLMDKIYARRLDG
jgi:GNAT superfamily N-acetyltransferase